MPRTRSRSASEAKGRALTISWASLSVRPFTFASSSALAVWIDTRPEAGAAALVSTDFGTSRSASAGRRRLAFVDRAEVAAIAGDVAVGRPLGEEHRHPVPADRRLAEGNALFDVRQPELTRDGAELRGRQAQATGRGVCFRERPELEGERAAHVAVDARVGDPVGDQHGLVVVQLVTNLPFEVRRDERLRLRVVGEGVDGRLSVGAHALTRASTIAYARPCSGSCAGA